MMLDLLIEDQMTFTEVAVITLLSVAMNGIAFAGPEEETILATFEALCLEHINDPGSIATITPRMGLIAVPDDKKVEFLGSQPGRAWINLDRTNRYILTITDEGSCGVSAPYVSGATTLALLLQNSRGTQLDTERIGSEIQSVYAITRPDRFGKADIHALVLITTSNLQSVDGIQLTAIPESLARKQGTTIPDWP
jgi:hypothetical protein